MISVPRKIHMPSEAALPGCAAWISIRNLSVTHGPQEINHGQQISDGKNGGTSSREHIEHLELRRILPISTRHTQISENELREKCEIKADEHKQRRQPAPRLRVHAPRNLRPPEVQPAEISHDRATHHDVVEVRNHEISIGH